MSAKVNYSNNMATCEAKQLPKGAAYSCHKANLLEVREAHDQQVHPHVHFQ